MAKQTPKPDTETPDAAAATAAPAGDQKDGTAVPAATDPTPPETGNEGTATAGAGEPVPASAEPMPFKPDLTGVDLSAKGPANLALTVHGPAKGRWRAGRHFTAEPVVINASEITALQAKQLEDDPELVCVWSEIALAV